MSSPNAFADETSVPLLAMSDEFRQADELEAKQLSTLARDADSNSSTVADHDWTAEEERNLVRKVDSLVMSLLILGFFALQLDRGNIGNALTDYFFRDVGITQNQFNIGQQLLSLGIVLLEIPSNLVLYRIGPSMWISGQIVAWGLVATFQAFQHGLPAFLITRLLLGLCESGFIPAGLYTITRWYKREETSKRYSWYFLGNMLAQAVSGLLAYAILHMRGVGGLAGWQWLFILEGVFTILVGLTVVSLFPRSPVDPTSLLGFRIFNERERHILVQRVLLDDPSKKQPSPFVPWPEVKRVLTNWRLLPHIVFTIAGLAPSNTMWSYGPTIVSKLGYGRLRSNAIWSIGQWILLILNLSSGFVADKLGARGPVVLFGGFLWWAFALASRMLIHSHDNRLRLAILILAYGCSSPWHPVNGSWLAMNAGTAGERSVTLAIFIMSANASGIIGSQLFQQQDHPPIYPIGWTVIVALVSTALLSMMVANVQYWLLNRWMARKLEGARQERYQI